MKFWTLSILACGLIAISLSAIFIEWSDAPASVIGMYRLLMATVVILPLAWRERSQVVHLSWQSAAWLAVSGLCLGLHFLFWIQSLKETSVASSLIMLALEPLFVMVGEWICLRSRIERADVLAMAIAIVGACIVAVADAGHQGNNIAGDSLSLLGTIAVSAYVLVGSRARKTLSPWLYNSIVFAIAGGVLALVNTVTGVRFAPYSLHNWIMFALLACVSTVLGHGLFNLLLNRLPPTTIAMTVVGEPIVATLLAASLLGQPVGLTTGLGGAICLTGVAWHLWRSAHKSNDHANPTGKKTEPANRRDRAESLDAADT
ncbi:drug/metabolite transporter (DMT)-like permease [Alicyclobacillus sacchari]|uniref:Drug/metabolite transporter (DMT)-like permease n=1 Tax=Alicyclobacillus sacchari TaxID=392010 RepID=A0A4R8LQ45_9BACL|nr:DMT family transporter [Alicyclobacillus sacchari]TDY49659.1 drug/metabolite transporter (DMT)-like permease [Alicyclobacillus sacchari]